MATDINPNVGINADIIETIPYTQEELEQSVRQILLGKGITDILYPGSNVSQLADVLTYLVHVLNTNTAINLQEILLPLATKRVNILWGARQVGYEAVQKISYIYSVLISTKIVGEDPLSLDIITYTIPKYSTFTASGNVYNYLGETITVRTSNFDITNGFDSGWTIGSPVQLIFLKEGEMKFFADNELLRQRTFEYQDENDEFQTKQDYLIPFRDVEDNGLEVFLTYIDENGTIYTQQPWNKSEMFLIDDSFELNQEKYVKLQNIYLQMPTIWFEKGGFGNKIRLNTLIETNALISKGRDGKADELFTIDSQNLDTYSTAGIPNLIVTGKDSETNTSIKENASIFHNSANRAVTALDYTALTNRHNKVKYTKVWGGEEETALTFAYVYLSMIPERTNRNIISVNELTNDESINNDYYTMQNLPNHPYIGEQLADYTWVDSSATTNYPDKALILAVGDFFDNLVDWTPVSGDLSGILILAGDFLTTDDGTATGAWIVDNTATNDVGDFTFTDNPAATIYPVITKDGDMVKSLNDFTITGGDLDAQVIIIGDNVTTDNGIFIFEGQSGDETLELAKELQTINWFLNANLDILEVPVPVPGSENRSVFTYLRPYKILTMRTTFRQPTYLNFDFDIKIVKYNIVLTKAATNDEIFNIVNNYFINYMERFDSEFFMSNLQGRINDTSSEVSGLEIDVKTNMELSPNNYDYLINTQNNNIKNMLLKLALPYDNIWDSSDLLQNQYLPQISSVNADLHTLNLLTDFTPDATNWFANTAKIPSPDDVFIATPVYLDAIAPENIVGYYIIRNYNFQDIEVQLYWSVDGSITSGPNGDFGLFLNFTIFPVTKNIPETLFTDSGYAYMDVNYPGLNPSIGKFGENIPVTENTIPRLRTVKFV